MKKYVKKYEEMRKRCEEICGKHEKRCGKYKEIRRNYEMYVGTYGEA